MHSTDAVERILANYAFETPGVRASLRRMLTAGKLAGTGKLVILPVDQGFEHGPDKSFLENEPAFDPHYHWELAIEAGLSAYAAPLGMLEAGADQFAGRIPTILKVNSSNSLMPSDCPKDQAVTASVKDALRLGCEAIGFTIYPGSSASFAMFEEIAQMRAEASACGIATVIWSYPRGEELSDAASQSALDVAAYAAHMAALLGAHVIKIKLPGGHFRSASSREAYEKAGIDHASPAGQVAHCMRAAFSRRRIVVFSGGSRKGRDGVLNDARAIRDGGGNGSIIGRNTFQRPREEALDLLSELISIYGPGG